MTPAIKKASNLIEWFWQDGYKRSEVFEGKYELPVAAWLAPLYRTRDELTALEDAAKPRAKALALWGASQTGKSTALSFIDAGKTATGDETTDGVDTGLYWDGGKPFIYQLPPRDKGPAHWHTRAYNPFNQSDDGSSCLTRIVGRRKIDDPMHPVEIKLIKPVDLLNTVARGFDTQCLGSYTSGTIRPWEKEHFERALSQAANRFQRQLQNAPKFDRTACERMFQLVTTIKTLHELKVQTFGERLAETPAELQQRLDKSLLQQDAFLRLPEAADAATALVLWRESADIQSEYVKLREFHEQLLENWAGKTIRASLEVAMLFVDFGSAINSLKNATGERQVMQAGLIGQLGWKEGADGSILLGCGPEYSNHLGATAQQYAMMQALVWELVLPVNLDRLPQDTPDTQMLAKVDILDFPGVGKDNLTGNSRINMQTSDSERGAIPGGGEPPKFPVDFFGKILKRGKTASIVANYARQRNIDSFAIMQSLKSDTPPSAEMIGQIDEGCASWARYAGHKIEGADHMPLHFVMTFWGQMASQFSASTSTNFSTAVEKHIKGYGWIKDRATAWALNYHWFQDEKGKKISAVDLNNFTLGSEVYEKVVNEPAFLKVFGRDVSRRSFDAMLALEDQARGGLTYFWTQLLTEIDRVKDDDRAARIAELTEKEIQTLSNLCNYSDFLPVLKKIDGRVETLEKFRTALYNSIAACKEAEMREVAYALRELSEVDPEQLPRVKLDRESMTASSIERAFKQWIGEQAKRHAGIAPDAPKWKLLGFAESRQLNTFLGELVSCMGEPVYREIAKMLLKRRALSNTNSAQDQEAQLRRYLAIEMVNYLCYYVLDTSDPDHPVRHPTRGAGASLPRREWDDKRNWDTDPLAASIAWRHTLKPWLEDHLPCLLAALAEKIERPELPGDKELLEIIPPNAAQN